MNVIGKLENIFEFSDENIVNNISILRLFSWK